MNISSRNPGEITRNKTYYFSAGESQSIYEPLSGSSEPHCRSIGRNIQRQGEIFGIEQCQLQAGSCVVSSKKGLDHLASQYHKPHMALPSTRRKVSKEENYFLLNSISDFEALSLLYKSFLRGVAKLVRNMCLYGRLPNIGEAVAKQISLRTLTKYQVQKRGRRQDPKLISQSRISRQGHDHRL